MKFIYCAPIVATHDNVNYRFNLFLDEELALDDGKVSLPLLEMSAAITRESPCLPKSRGGNLLTNREIAEIYLPSLDLVGALLLNLKSQRVSLVEFFATIETFKKNGWGDKNPLGPDYALGDAILPSVSILDHLGIDNPKGWNLPKKS